jgi:hypothetical protein
VKRQVIVLTRITASRARSAAHISALANIVATNPGQRFHSAPQNSFPEL